MSIEKNPRREAVGGRGIRVEESGAGLVAADAYACAIKWKEMELHRLQRGSEAYDAKNHVIRELEKVRADILTQIDAMGG